MSFGKYGVNTMRPVSNATLLLLFGIIAFFLGTCGKESGSEHKTVDAVAVQQVADSLSEEDRIEGMLNDVMDRLRYGDKSGLYDNEFEYFTDETTFDEYLGMGQVRWANADTLTFIEVRHIEFFDRDSALVDVTVHFEGPTGQKSFLREKLQIFYHRGRWIKPTVTSIDLQMAYEGMIRVADSAAAADAEDTGQP